MVRRPVADEPHTVFVRPERLHEILEAVLEIEYGSDDRKGRRLDDTLCVRRQNGGEIDGKAAVPLTVTSSGGQSVATPHVQAQSEVERVGVHDEIGNGEHE